MTVQAPDVIEVVEGAGAPIAQSVPGYFFKIEQVRVWLVEIVDGASVETPLIAGTDYTLTTNKIAGSNPTHYTGSIATVANITNQQHIVVMVWPLNEQLTDFSAIPHNPADYEQQHDLAAIRDQVLLEIIKRSPRLDFTYEGDQKIIEQPEPGKVLQARADGKGWENGPASNEISSAQDYAERAEAAAAAAEGSASAQGGPFGNLISIANLAMTTFPETTSHAMVMGGNEFGDVQPFAIKRLSTAPDTPAIIHKQSFDGDWWEIPASNGTLSTAQVGLMPNDSQWGSAVNEMIAWLARRGDGWNGGQLVINPPPEGELALSQIEFNQQIQLDPRVNVRGLSTRTTRLVWTGDKRPAVIVGDEDFRQTGASTARQMILSDFTLAANDGANQGHGLVVIGAPNSQISRLEIRGFNGIDAGENGDLARGFYLAGNSAVLGETANSMEAHYHLVKGLFCWENGINIGVNAVLAQGQTNATTFLHCIARNARGNSAATTGHAKAYEHYHSGNVHLMNCHNVRFIGGSREMGGAVGNGTSKARYGTSFGPGCHECYEIGAYYEGNYGDSNNPTPYHFQDDATCYSNMVDVPLLSSEWVKSNPESANWSVDPGKRNEVRYRRHDFSGGGQKFKTKHIRAGGELEVHEFDKVANDHQTVFSEVRPSTETSYLNTTYARWGSDQAAAGYKVDMPFRLGSIDPSTVGGLNGSMWRHPITRMPTLYETASQFGGNRAFGIHVPAPAAPTSNGSPGMFSVSGGFKYEVEAADNWGRSRLIPVTGSW